MAIVQVNPGILSRYQNISILEYFIGAKDDGDGGDKWRYRT